MTRVLAVGEILWDVFGDERHLGGAPFNFTYHCAALGAHAQVVSRVGGDELGHAIRDRASTLNVPGDLIQEDAAHATGTVNVTVDAEGVPSYEIAEPVAWDYIEYTDQVAAAAAEAEILCFGSLAQRKEISRETIRRALRAVREKALRVFDINLRQHFFTLEIIQESLRLSNILKLNDDELTRLTQMFSLPQDTKAAMELLAQQFQLQAVVLTRGAGGAEGWSDGEYAATPGITVKVVDTVGSGDAFAAAFVTRFAEGEPLAEALRFANAAGAYVATQPGATPPITAALVEELIK